MKNIRNGLILSAALALGSSAAFAAASIEVNGACQTGPSPCAPGTVSPGTNDSGTFNFNAVVSGDTFNFSGNYLNTLDAAGQDPQENWNLKVTLVSTAGGTGATTKIDDINTTSLLEDFTYLGPNPQTFFEIGNFSFGGGVASTSNGEEWLTVDGLALPTMDFTVSGPFSGSAFGDNFPTSNPLLLSLTDVMEFGAGSPVGSYIQQGLASVPEPSYGIAMGAVLAGLGLLRMRNRNKRSVL